MESKTAVFAVVFAVALIATIGLIASPAGFFVTPGAKEYGGAIKGVKDPYSRSFQGRAYEFPSGKTPAYAGQWGGSQGVAIGGKSYGSTAGPVAVSEGFTYGRQASQIPGFLTACEGLAIVSGMGRFTEPASVQQMSSNIGMGRNCIRVEDMSSISGKVGKNQIARVGNEFENARSLGVAFCCEAPNPNQFY